MVDYVVPTGIRIADTWISESDVVRYFAVVQDAARSVGVALTFFEIATIMAFLAYRDAAVDVAVVEVGLGGRLDATNVVSSVVTSITSIALDHAEYLGSSIAEVAREKAGLIKAGSVLVTGALPDEACGSIKQRVRELGVEWLRFGRDFEIEANLRPRLAGLHQRQNAAVAAACVRALPDALRPGEEAIRAGIAAAAWPGRFEPVAERPAVVLDAAHNPHAARALLDTVESQSWGRPRVLVFGVMADKDWRSMLDILAPSFDHVVLVSVSRARALDPRIAAAALGPEVGATVAVSIAAGLNEATSIAGTGGAVVVTGSIFLIGEAYGVTGGGVGVPSDVVFD